MSARSCNDGMAASTPCIDEIARANESAPANTLPPTGFSNKSGSIRDMCSSESRLKPLNTDNTTTIAIVATATPAIDTAEMTLTAL